MPDTVACGATRCQPCLLAIATVTFGDRRTTTSALSTGLTKKLSPGCMNAAGKAGPKWYAKAVTKFTKPGARLLAEPFTFLSVAVSLEFLPSWGTNELD